MTAPKKPRPVDPVRPPEPHLGQAVVYVAGRKLPHFHGRHLAAHVSQVGPGPFVHLHVLMPETPATVFAGSVRHDEEKHENTWHYPKSTD